MVKHTTLKVSAKFFSSAFGLFFLLAAYDAPAVNVWWDNNGTSTPSSGTWDTSSANWTTATNLVSSRITYTNGNFPEFTAGGDTPLSSVTITVNSAVTCAGLATGVNSTSGDPVTNLTFSGSGSIGIVTNGATYVTNGSAINAEQGFYCGPSGSGLVTINVPLTGAGGIQQHGSASLALYGNNSFAGGVAVTGGQLIYYNNNNSFGTGPILIPSGGGGGAFVNGAGSAITISNNVLFTAAGLNLNMASAAAGTTYSGTFSLPSGTTELFTGGAGQLTQISGVMSGSGAGLMVDDGGILQLSGVNTFTGGLTLTNHLNPPTTLAITGSGSLNSGNYAGNITNVSCIFIYGSSASQTLSGVISGAGSLIQNGSGILTLSGANTYTGGTSNGTTLIVGGGGTLAAAGKITNNGTFVFQSSAAQTISGIISGSGTMNINDTGSGAVTLTGANTYTGITTISNGLLSVTNDNGLGAAPGSVVTNQLFINSGTTGNVGFRAASATFSLNTNRGITIGPNGGAIQVAQGFTLTYNGVISGSGNLEDGTSSTVGLGTLNLGGSNTYTGTTTITAGTLNISSNANLGAVPASFVSNQITLNSGTLGMTATAIDIPTNSGIWLETNSVISVSSSQSPSIESVISGAWGLTKSSSGNLNLNGANTFSGGLTVTGGGVRFNNNSAAGTGAITVTPASIVTLRSITPPAATLVTITNPIVLNANGGSDIDLAAATGNTNIFSGPISGVGYFTRGRASGSGGVFILSGSNSFSGGLILEGGTLGLGSSNALGTGTLTVTPGNNNAVVLQAEATLTGMNAITNPVNIVMTNGTNLTINGSSSFELAGPVGLSNSTASFVTITNNNSTPTIISGVVRSMASGIGLTVAGSGTLMLNGANTYNGNTTVSSGTLALGASGSIGNSPTISIAAGATLDVSANSAFALSATNNISAAGTNSAPATINGALGGTVSLGSQTITLAYDGTDVPLVIAQGQLVLSGNAFVVNGAVLSAGTYTLVQQASGSISATGPFTVSGTALGSSSAVIQVTGGNVVLTVFATPTFSSLANTPDIYGAMSTTLTGNISAVVGGVTNYPVSGDAVSATINGHAVNGSVTDSTGDFSITYNDISLATDPAGTYPITYIYAGNNSVLLNPATNTSSSLMIAQAPLTVSATAQSKTYGQTIVTTGSTNFTSSGLVNGETIGSVSLAVSGTPSGAVSNAPVSGSPYTITPSAATGGTFNPANYGISYNTALLTVNPASLLVTADSYSIPYGATNPVLTVTYSNFVNGETLGTSDVGGAPALATAATTNSDVGTYTITNSIGTLTSTNYTFALTNGVLTITNALSTNVVTADTNPALPGATVTFTATLSTLAPSTAVPTNIVQLVLDGTNYGAAAYPSNGVLITAISGLSHGNHTFESDYAGDTNSVGATNILGSTNSVTELINTPPVAGTATYSRPAAQSLTIPISSLLTNATDADGDAISFVSVSATSTNSAMVTSDGTNVYYTPAATNANVTDAFSYTVADSFGATSSGTVVVTVTAVTPVFSALTAAPTITYGTASISLGGNLVAAGPLYPAMGDTVNASINGHSVSGTVIDGLGNFTVNYNDASLASDGVSSYAITYSYGGNPGAFLTGASDSSTSLTVTPAASPTVTATAQSKTYGQSVASGSGNTNFIATGLLNGETIGSVTLAFSGTPSGDQTNAPVAGSPYTITPSAAAGGTFNPANYSNINYVTGLLTVNPASLLVTADSYTVVYGQVIPTLGVTYSNFVNGETLGTSDVGGAPSLTTGATSSSDVGTYTITNSIGALTSTNYSFILSNGLVTITPLPVNLTGTRPYDGTATASASILTITTNYDGTNLTLSGSALLAGSAAGTEAITDFTGLALGGTAATNYTLSNASGSVTIGTVALSITANPVSKTYGTAISLDPTAFTVGGGPLVGTETPTAVTMTPSGGTGATDPVAGSPYTITPSAATGINGFMAANYNITYNTNSLTVNPLVVVLAGTRPYDGTAVATNTILSVANKVGGDDVDLASGSANLSSIAVGTNSITSLGSLALGGVTGPNYTLSGAGGAVVITDPGLPFSITSVNIDGTGTNLVTVFQSIPGDVYQLLSSTNILTSVSSWTSEGSPITATGLLTTNITPYNAATATKTYVYKNLK